MLNIEACSEHEQEKVAFSVALPVVLIAILRVSSGHEDQKAHLEMAARLP
jgi:hypothetical protein